MSEQFDLADRRILFELDCNSRQSISELARKVCLGRDLVEYRIQRLFDIGVLKRSCILTNPYKLGLTIYKSYLRLETDKGRIQELIAYLDRHPRTYWLAECYGEWDLILSHLAHTPKEFYDFQDTLFSNFKDIIGEFCVYTLVNYWWFPRKFLLGATWEEEWRSLQRRLGDSGTSTTTPNGWRFETPEFTFGTTPDEYPLDELEFRLIDALGKDARKSYTELAELVGSTPSVVKYRLDKLLQLGVVAGFRIDVDRAALGMSLYKVMVHLRDYDVKKELEFREFCRRHPHVTCYVQQLGNNKIEFEVEAKNQNEFNLIIDEVRERFSKYIKYMNYLTIRRDYDHRLKCLEFLPASADKNKDTNKVNYVVPHSLS